jgi:hypothetical protein
MKIDRLVQNMRLKVSVMQLSTGQLMGMRWKITVPVMLLEERGASGALPIFHF